MAENPTYKYNIILRILHWSMALMFIVMLIIGFVMTKLNAETSSYKWKMYDLHKSFGIMFLVMTLIRVIIRINSYIPPYNYEFSKLIRFLSSFVQNGFYILFLIIPLSGFFSSILAGYEVKLFSYKIPIKVFSNKMIAVKLHYLHSVLPYLSILFIIMHISGVIKHRYFDKKDILDRMI